MKHCSTARHALSECLDGRLPSGRRAEVMAHVAHCGDCAEFWRDLQRMRELTDGLDRRPVGNNFRTGLWRRIESGEGTPEAVFAEPVPLRTRVRYLAAGAAAAAALLAILQWAGPDAVESPAGAPSGPQGDGGQRVAAAQPAPLEDGSGRTRPAPDRGTVRGGDAGLDTPWPRSNRTLLTGHGVEPDMLARTVGRNVAAGARTMRSLTGELRGLPLQQQPMANPALQRLEELREILGQLGNESRLLLEMKDNNLVDLVPRAEASLRFVVLQRNTLPSPEAGLGREVARRLVALEDAANTLVELPYDLRVPADVRTQDMQRLTEVICNLVIQDPGVGRSLSWLQAVPDGPGLPFENCVQQFLIGGQPGMGPRVQWFVQSLPDDGTQTFRVEIRGGATFFGQGEPGPEQPPQIQIRRGGEPAAGARGGLRRR